MWVLGAGEGNSASPSVAGSGAGTWINPVQDGAFSRRARLREDVMIVNDMMTVPGFADIRHLAHGGVMSENDQGVRLTVMLANRQPLEELTGTDLIYYNDNYESFVMVQYKAMETMGGESILRLPNSQLNKELERMEAVLKSIHDLAPPSDRRGYRLLWDPFFSSSVPVLFSIRTRHG
jgi:hypothetical protein